MKKLIILIAAVLLTVGTAGYIMYMKTVDTEYAIGFAEAFQNYDINTVDEYFSVDTVFEFNGTRKKYKELRSNIKKACNEKLYEFSSGSSYGHGNDKFINGVQTVKIMLSGIIRGEDFGDCVVIMKLKRTGMFSFAVESVKCDEAVFGELFFQS